MKALHIIASLATAALLFAAAPDACAQRGALQRGNGGGHDSRGSHSVSTNHGSNNHQSAAPSHNNGGSQLRSGHNGGGSNHSAAPRHNNGGPQLRSGHNGGGNNHSAAPRHGANPVRNAPAGHPYRHNAPAAHHAPAPAPHHQAPAPRHYAAPRHQGPAPRYAARPRHHGPAPIYHQHIDRRARVFYIDEQPYYSWGGVYYRYIPSYGYEEIYMPQDVVVTELPYGAAVTYVNNIGYYQADGMWFQPVDGGYLLVERPVASVTVAVPRPTVSFHASFGF